MYNMYDYILVQAKNLSAIDVRQATPPSGPIIF